MTERRAQVLLQGWFGMVKRDVTVVGETPKRYRIISDVAIGVGQGRSRSTIQPGVPTLVPKYAVKFLDE